MDFRFTPEQEALRQEIKDFLQAAQLSPGISEDGWIGGTSTILRQIIANRGLGLPAG